MPFLRGLSYLSGCVSVSAGDESEVYNCAKRMWVGVVSFFFYFYISLGCFSYIFLFVSLNGPADSYIAKLAEIGIDRGAEIVSI